MSKSLRITIPEPCHEDWNAMTPLEDGSRHCDSCAKNIVDFTYMTDREIHQYIRQNNGRICGRWRKDQLDRPILDVSAKRSSLPRLAATAAGILLSGGGISAQTGPGEEEQAPKPNLSEMVTELRRSSIELYEEPEIVGGFDGVSFSETAMRCFSVATEIAQIDRLNTEQVILRGRVVDKSYDDPFISATCAVYDSHKKELITGTFTDTDGAFYLAKAHPSSIVEFTYTGYESKTIDLRNYPVIDGIIDVGDVGMDAPYDASRMIVGTLAISHSSRDEPEVDCNSPEAESPASSHYLNEVVVSPNPFIDHIRLELTPEGPTTLKAKLFDMDGRLLRSWASRDLHRGQQEVTLGGRYLDILPGHYYLLLEDSSGRTETRVVIKQNR